MGKEQLWPVGTWHHRLRPHSTPVQVVELPTRSLLTGVVAISAGDGHSLALMGDGTVRAWGYNSQGQLGNNSITNSGTPVFVDGLSGIVAIAGGFQASLALQSQAIGTAWGDNTDGCLGNAGGSSSVPTAVDTLSGLDGNLRWLLAQRGIASRRHCLDLGRRPLWRDGRWPRRDWQQHADRYHGGRTCGEGGRHRRAP